MSYFTESDNELIRELASNEVAPGGLELNPLHGEGVLVTLARNPTTVDTKLWLKWLTGTRQLMRLATLPIDGEWIASRKFSREMRSQLCEEVFMPISESAGTWITAAIENDPKRTAAYEKKWGVRIMLVAPTPEELRQILPFYNVAFDN